MSSGFERLTDHYQWIRCLWHRNFGAYQTKNYNNVPTSLAVDPRSWGRQVTLSLRCVTSQKSVNLIYTSAEAWNHAIEYCSVIHPWIYQGDSSYKVSCLKHRTPFSCACCIPHPFDLPWFVRSVWFCAFQLDWHSTSNVMFTKCN